MSRLTRDGTAELHGTMFSGVNGDGRKPFDHKPEWHPYSIYAQSAVVNDDRYPVIYSPVLSACPLHTDSGCAKERCILIGPW